MNAVLTLPNHRPRLFLLVAAAVWFVAFQALAPVSELLTAALPVDRASHLGGALQFFFYDTPKVLLLLTGVVFVMGMINSYFTPERTRVAPRRPRRGGVAMSWRPRSASLHRSARARQCRCSSGSCRRVCRLALRSRS